MGSTLMEPYYKNGRPFSPRVMGALKYISHVGVMTKEVWGESFFHGSKRWKNKQLKILLTNRLLKLHTCDLGNFYVLGERGVELAKELKWSIVDPVTPRQIRHDETVGHGLLKLERAGLCQQWETEKELKSKQFKEVQIRDLGGQSKYPDSIFKALLRGKFRSVALEYERSGKTVPRYRSILWSYNSLTAVSMVLFIVEDETIKKRIKYSLRYLGNVQLLERIAFMDAKEWKRNPVTATIELSTKKTSFEKLSLPVSA